MRTGRAGIPAPSLAWSKGRRRGIAASPSLATTGGATCAASSSSSGSAFPCTTLAATNST